MYVGVYILVRTPNTSLHKLGILFIHIAICLFRLEYTINTGYICYNILYIACICNCLITAYDVSFAIITKCKPGPYQVLSC